LKGLRSTVGRIGNDQKALIRLLIGQLGYEKKLDSIDKRIFLIIPLGITLDSFLFVMYSSQRPISYSLFLVFKLCSDAKRIVSDISLLRPTM
jgi:hypothetical protein